MIRFAHTEYLYGLILLPFILALFVWALRMRKRGLERFGNPELLKRLMPEAGKYKRPVKFFLVAAAFGLLVLGVANPQIGTKMEEVKREGVDVMIAVDVSNSMKCEDIKPNRLESAKQEISRLLDKLRDDRLGLIVFGGESYLQLPLTADYSAARLMLSTVDVDAVPVQGTAIGSAIRLAMKSFPEEQKKHEVLIIITDGENHEDDAVAAAKDAAAAGVVVHTIGMGSPEGGPIPVYENGSPVGFKKDGDGNTVITKLDEQALREIAEAGGGTFTRATNQQNELDEIFKRVGAMEKKEFGSRVFTEFEDRFQYAIGAAILLLVAEFFISERRNRWLAGWNLFKERA